jgi:PAS domain S-box-containing protein
MPIQIRPVRSVAILASITIGVMLVAAASLLLSLRARELKRAQHESVSLAQMLMEQTDKTFTGADLVLQGVQERLASPIGRQFALNSRMVQLLLNARVSGLKNISSIFLVDASGMQANSSGEASGERVSVAASDYFKVFAEGRPDFVFVDKPTRNRLDNTWTLNISRRLAANDGKFLGVVVAAISIPDFEKSLMDVQLDHARAVSLYTSDGTLVASMPRRDPLIGQPAPELAGLELPTKPRQIVTVRHNTEAGGSEYLAVGKLTDFPLMLSVTDSEALSLAPWRETAIPAALGVLLVSVFTAVLSIYLIGKLQRKEALTVALNSANDRYQHTVDSVMDAIVAVDQNMTILLFNPAAARMFGRPAADALGQSLDVLIPSNFRQVHAEHMEQFASPDHVLPRTVVPQRNIVGLRTDGSVFPIESTFSKSVVDGHVQMTAVLRDASEKHRAEQELREANRQLRELSNSLTQVREQERTRISRELHDDLGQQLTGLKLSLSWLGNRIKDGRETAAQNVDDMRYQLDGAIASVRRIAAELRPRVLDDLDFAEALTWQTREFTRHSGLEVNLNLQAGALITDNRLATALFRITQEALTNVVRHAQASQVSISLTEQGGRLMLSIRDDGVGFDESLRMTGVGLVGMRERSTAIGGVFDIASTEGAGTAVSVSVALATVQASEEAT